jgi:hypothetical protein
METSLDQRDGDPCKQAEATLCSEISDLESEIGTARIAICRRFRCHSDNDRMDLTGQLSNLSSDLRELLSKG